MTETAAVGSHTVARVYEELKHLAITYVIKPGSRVNEGEVARWLGVSRTPLREALNRLVVAGFLDFAPSQGFFRKSIDPAEIFDLYEMRQAIEVASVRLAAERASAGALAEIEDFLSISATASADQGIEHLVKLDEGFHERLVALTGNKQMLASMRSINDRIRFFRWIDMEEEKRVTTQDEHRRVVAALRGRDGELAASVLSSHIGCRREQIVAQVKEGYARIFVNNGTFDPASQFPLDATEFRGVREPV